jgi:hypothetical protein
MVGGDWFAGAAWRAALPLAVKLPTAASATVRPAASAITGHFLFRFKISLLLVISVHRQAHVSA